MRPARAHDRRRRTIELDVLMLATAGILLVATLIPQLDPDLNIVMKDRTLDVALSALTMVAVTGLAVLSFLRYRETGRLASFVQASAYALWATYSTVTLLLMIFRVDGRLGLTLGAPEQLPLWVAAAVRVGVAALFMASGVAALAGIYGSARRRIRSTFLPVAVIGLGTIVLYPVRGLLPPLIEEAGLTALLSDPGDFGLLPGFTGLTLASVVLAVAGLLAAVVLYRMTWGRGGPTSDAFTALGLVILVVAEVQNAFWPSVYTNLVTIADIMRLIAYLVLVAGAFADQRSDLRSLRSAYTALDRMRVNDAERAALEERARLAREIHDGLAQHLWFAKLKFERLAGTLDEAAQPLAAEVTSALDAAIIEAREALVTMRASLVEAVPFSDMLARTVDDFEDRSGLRVEFAMPSGVPANLAPRVQVELLRIVSEALTNVRKHADATTVRINADVADGEMLLTITDNGRGFMTDRAFDQGMGLRGMHERARLIGGSLEVRSELSGGTTVEIRAPVLAGGVASAAETSVRTLMAPAEDLEPTDLQLELPAAAAEGVGSGAGGTAATAQPTPMRGTTTAPDARGVRP